MASKKKLNFNEYLEYWCNREFNRKYADKVYEEMVDCATGNKPCGKFAADALKRIKKAYAEHQKTGNLR